MSVLRATCLLLCMFTLLAASASAITVDQLIDSYDYDFYDGTVNVTNATDAMRDLDSDGVNDTLVINVTTDANVSVRYYVIIELLGNRTVVSNYSNVTVNSSSKNAVVTFDSRLLDRGQYNYTIRIRDQDFGLAYLKYKTQTQDHANYRRGTTITSITDQNNANSTLRVTVNLNVTKNETGNVTVWLAYGNSTIVGTKSATLTSPSAAVVIDIGNETVKSTHHNGTYRITTVQVVDKLFARNQTTGSYAYADFAKTSYIKSIASGSIENTSNNLTDALRFNVTVSAKTTTNCTVTIVLADEFGDPIVILTKNQTLSVGDQIVTLELAGPVAYWSRISGAFQVAVATLAKSTAVIDTVTNAHTTDQYQYTDFEPPARPDIALEIRTASAGSILNVTVNATNYGTTPAYNVVVDLFDNGTYENQTAFAAIAANQSATATFTGGTEGNIFVAIADFDNQIDESNESNNVASTYVQSVLVDIVDLTPNATTKVLEATYRNNGTASLTNITWALDLDDGAVLTNTTNLSTGETFTLIAQHTYAAGSYVVTANTSADSTADAVAFDVGNGSATLSITLVNWSSAVNVTSNRFFPLTAQVCCSGADCGSVNVTADPEPASTSAYAPALERHCIGGTCTTSFYSTPRFGFEDGVWKPLSRLRSFVGTTPIACDVRSDGVHHVECLEYNATSRTLRVALADSTTGTVPIRVLDRNAQGVLSETSRTSIVLSTPDQEAIVRILASDRSEIHVGATSTNITLLPNASLLNGWWEITAGSQAAPNWTSCDANTYSGSDKSQISVNSTASKIYEDSTTLGTAFSVCNRLQWNLNITPSNITQIATYVYWGGEPHNGSDAQTKALYIGNVTVQTWTRLQTTSNAFSAQQSGSVSDGISDYVENVSGHAYVYTLLHMNASKASSSNGAYVEFYYAELRITTGANASNESSNTTSKGDIPTTTGATPFYTNGTNPTTIALNAGQCQNVTWWVNATGTVNSSYLFFAFANRTTNPATSSRTSDVNVTIIANETGNSSSLPQLVANYTFTSSAEGFTLNTGWNWNSGAGLLTYNGSDFGGSLYSANASLKSYTNGYNITFVFTSGNITNTKFYFASSGSSLTGDKYNFERQNETHQHFKHDSVGYSQTDNYQNGVERTIRISVNVTGNTTRACRVGGSCSNSEGIGSASFGDFLAISPGTMNGKNKLNITAIEVWRTG